jgi:hypothetical protein
VAEPRVSLTIIMHLNTTGADGDCDDE